MVDTAGYLMVGVAAALVTFVATPIVGSLARRFGWVVQPDERRVHSRPTPDVGGIAMFCGFLAAMGLAVYLDRFNPLFESNSEPLGVVLGCAIVFLVGLADDIFELSAPAKVTGIVVAGVVLVAFGVTMFYFRVPFRDVFVLSSDWIPLVTVLWLLVMTQAVNLIDGLDGLAAGIVLIASGSFFLYSNHLGQLHLLDDGNIGPLIAIITAGVCLGFLPHNFNPARIFMGDSGALFLGSLLAVSTSVVGGRADPSTQQYTGQTFFFFAPIFIPLVHPRHPDLRHAVRDRAPGEPAPEPGDRRQGSPAPPPDEPRPWPAPQRADPLAVDRAPQRFRPLPGVHAVGRRRGAARHRRPRPRPLHRVAPAGAPTQR